MDHNSGKNAYPPSFEDLKNDNWISNTDDFVKNGGYINSPLLESGAEAGYTTLHFLCLVHQNQTLRVSRLIDHCNVNVNSMAKDGAQPIHLACLLDNVHTVEILLKSGANVNAEITKELHQKYAKDHEWTNDFGGTMTLLAWTIINSLHDTTKLLLTANANFLEKDINRKNLLMYAVELNNLEFVKTMMLYSYRYPELIEDRDSRDWNAVHYIIPNNKFGVYRYHPGVFSTDLGPTTTEFIKAEADLNVTVNGNPDTLLLNMAAYRLIKSLLIKSLDFRVRLIDKSKPLRYLTLPVEDSTKWNPLIKNDNFMTECIRRIKNECLKYILYNFVIRRSLGWYVPKDEIQLMDQLVAEDPKIRKHVSDCEGSEIFKFLKSQVFYYGDKFISLHEIAEKIYNHRLLQMLVYDDIFIKSYNKFYDKQSSDAEEINNIIQAIDVQIITAYKRRKILERLKTTKNLMIFIPLSYDVILCIFDFLDNPSLSKLNTALNDAYFNDDNSYSDIFFNSIHERYHWPCDEIFT